MSRTIKRGPPPRRPVARRRIAQPSLWQRTIARVPVSEDTVRKGATWACLALAGMAAIAVATWLGVPGAVGTAMAEGAGRAGFRVEQIEVTGLKRMDRMSVYAVALDQQSRAMPLVDLEEVRQKLLRYGWIADAQVSRRLPDTLLVHIDERVPAAVWQDAGELTLIDAAGTLLEPVDPRRMPALPLVIGPGAHRQEVAYQALLATAPALKPRVKAATWVGNRRWDLTFDSGETLALPEEGSHAALLRFAELDGARGMLGKGWKRFDMRDPAKLVARKPGANEHHSVPDPSTTTDGGGAGNGPAPAMAAGADAEVDGAEATAMGGGDA